MLPACSSSERSRVQVDDDDRGSRRLRKCHPGMVLVVVVACSRR
jgi:hypothetical protein